MHRSVSVYTLSKHAHPHPLELAGAVSPTSTSPSQQASAASAMLPPAQHAHPLPRSLSLQRLNFHTAQPHASPAGSQHSTPYGANGTPYSNQSTPFHLNGGRHSRGPSVQHYTAAAYASSPGGMARMRKVVSTASVEVLDDDTPVVLNPRRASSEHQQSSVSPMSEAVRRSRSGPHAVRHSSEEAAGTHENDDADETDDLFASHTGGVLLTSPTSAGSARGAVLSPGLEQQEHAPEPSADSPELRASSTRPISFPAGARSGTQPSESFMRSGNALVHPPPTLQLGSSVDHGEEGAGSFSSSSLYFDPAVGGGASTALAAASSSLPTSLIEDFDIVGRAGDNNTCDSWIVRSKFSGKMAVFKPRDGEHFEEKKKWEEAEEERIERERRRARAAGNSKLFGLTSSGTPQTGAAGSQTALSTSCPLPHPLSIPPDLRTPIKRGVLYGETTRKEVAAYLMDHEHFARVPKTLEATIWLQQHEAPAQGRHHQLQPPNTGTAYDEAHPYGHSVVHHGRHMLALNSASPPLGPQQPPAGRLLLQAPTISPPLQPQASNADPTLFTFEQEEWMAPAAVPSGAESGGRSLFGRSAVTEQQPPRSSVLGSGEHQLAPPTLHSPAQPTNVRLSPPAAPSESNLQPPALLHESSSSSQCAVTSSSKSPELPSTAGTTPDELSSLGLGLGLPASTAALIATYGSLQEYVENGGSAEDMGSAAFSADEVHRIGILDVRLLNLDRHLGNLLVQKDQMGQPHLIPIDHGYCLPSYTDLADVHLEWTYWRQCSEPFSPLTLRYIQRLDPIADAAKLRNLGIRDEALVSMVFSSLLLQHAAREGLSLFHIARMVQRQGDGEDPSTLETIVSRVLGFQQAQNGDASPSPTGSPGPTHFDFSSPTHSNLPAVVEEDQSGNVSPSAASSSMPPPMMGSPPMSPSAATDASSGSSIASGLLTRSNSDGAMALAEAISRQSSAPGLQRTASENSQATSSQSQAGSSPPSASSSRLPGQGPPLSKRRSSVADAAKQLIDEASAAAALASPAVVHTAGPVGSPPSQPAPAAPYSSAFSTPVVPPSIATPPPGPMLRLASALDEPHRSSSYSPNGDGDMPVPSGAKLQHLLHVTESVIREEVQAYCAREGLMPSPSSTNGAAAAAAAASPTKSPVREESFPSSPLHSTRKSGSPRTMSPRGSLVFNATVRPPVSPLRGFAPSTVVRSVSADADVLPLSQAAAAAASPASALTASLRRTRSASIESLAMAGNSAGGGSSSSPRLPVRAVHDSKSGGSPHRGVSNGASDPLSPTQEAATRRHSLRSPLAHASPTEIVA